MSESDLWRMLHKRTAMHGHFERIENMVGAGMPDVTYCVRGHEGFIELKQIAAFPVRPETVVPIPHYTPQQRIWARRRLAAGGKVYTLLEVVRPVPSYYLFAAEWSRVHLGKTATRADLRDRALVYGVGSFPIQYILQILEEK